MVGQVGYLQRVDNPLLCLPEDRRRLATGAQDAILPHVGKSRV
jgi:hypothetical protein